MKASDRSERRRDGLVGKYFNTFHPNGSIHRQGIVLSSQGAEHFLVQYLWDNGTPDILKVFHISKMLDWVFYNSTSEMTASIRRMPDA